MIKKYSISDTHYEISGKELVKYNPLNKKIEFAVVPYGVASIGKKAFENCSQLKYIIIPDTVTSIDDLAFLGCNNLRSVNIPSSVHTIGEVIFAGCTKLRHLYIPDNVKRIGSLFDYTEKTGHPDVIPFIRIPLRLIFQTNLDHQEIGTLVIGMPEYPNSELGKTLSGRSLYPLDAIHPEFIESDQWPNIILESYDLSHFPYNSIISIDGMVIGDGCDESMYENVEDDDDLDSDCELTTIYALPKHVLAVPFRVNRLGKYSVALRSAPLYIPETVISIDEEAFCECPGSGRPILITPKSNVQHLEQILPASYDGIKVIII